MMTQYRIIRKNSYFGWCYIVQRKIFGLFWIKFCYPLYNEFDLENAQNFIVDKKRNDKNFAERKKAGNSVV